MLCNAMLLHVIVDFITHEYSTIKSSLTRGLTNYITLINDP